MTPRAPHSRSVLFALRLPFLLIAMAFGLTACSVGMDRETSTVADASTTQPPDPVSTTSTAPPSSTTSSTTSTTSTPSTSVPEDLPGIDLEALDTLTWTPCGSLQCTTVEVPVDYDDPASEMIEIAINKRTADSPEDRIGYLLANPGGPGSTGLQIVREADGVWSADVRERFDIVSFDPRGIGESEPTLSCGSEDEQAEILESYREPGTPEHLAFGERMLNLCFENSGPALSRVHAQYVARDMDEIRKRLGVDQISFHGLSWGSHIGVWYATLFPEHTRAMVIDAALDPTEVGHTRVQMTLAYDDLLRQALEACDESCPIHNGAYPIGYYLKAMKKFDLVAEAMGPDGDLGEALLAPVYSAGAYPELWNAIYELEENGNPQPFVEIGSQAESAEPTAEQLAMIEKHSLAQQSANCVDEFVLHPQVDRDYLLNEPPLELPLLNAAFSSIAPEEEEEADGDEDVQVELNFCAFLHRYAPPAFTGVLDGSDVPIVVVANVFEGRIPYGQSKTLATNVLSNGYLIDVLGSGGHVVYPTNQCVVDLVDARLLTLELPDERATECEAEDPELDDDAFEQLAEQIHGQCRSRVESAIGDIEQAPRRASIVCERLINRAMNEQGVAGLQNGDYLDELLEDFIPQAQALSDDEIN